MAKACSAIGIIDTRSAGILRDYVLSHEPCAPGAAAHARRRMYEHSSMLSSNKGGRGCGCTPCSDTAPVYGGGGPCAGVLNKYGIGQAGGCGQRGMGLVSSVPEEHEDLTKFDRARDWVTCAGAVVVAGCSLGMVHSFAVFAPSIQHNYQTGLVETILVGVLCYAFLVALLPISNLVLSWLEHRWTGIFGMLLLFIGVLLDAMTLHISTFYISHLFFIALGGSLAYQSAMTICSDHFRRRLSLALCMVTCAPSIGTIVIYFLSNLMLSYISYLWTKLCLSILVLVCMCACQTFPERSQHFPWYTDKRNKTKVKECLQQYAKQRDTRGCCEEPAAHRSFLCVCVCDISIWTDYSFLLWGVICMAALLSAFIPYVYLMSIAIYLGTDAGVGLICYLCLASMLTRIAFLNSNDHTFGFNRTLFQACCIGLGILYIFVNWAQTFGWILVWGLAVGALEGILAVCIPRVTLQTVPLQWLGTCWTWTIIFHAVGLFVGIILMVGIFYSIMEYGPALIMIGVAQILAGILAFLLPNEEEDVEVFDQGKSLAPVVVSPGIERSFPSPCANYTARGGNAYPATFSTANDYSKSATAGTSGNVGGVDSNLALPLGSSPKNDCFDRPYASDCPICSKIGCIPGCCDCTPGGLTKSFNNNNNPYAVSKLPMPSYAGCKDFVSEINSYLDNYKTQSKNQSNKSSTAESKPPNQKNNSSSSTSKPSSKP